ncbi:MAG: 5TMR of 5TMR-LYT [Methanomassiliicoccales archaeon PtaU1.Bin124]|nr:MAG: 5TMR of 5TMR-LYT [Methanomassiliicoccales archaeon PtaU1.Bin124]
MNGSDYLVMFGYLVAQMVLVIAVTFALSRTRIFKEVITNKLTPFNCIAFIVIFGALAIVGTYLAIDYETSKVNLRDFPVIIAGLLGGPIIGTGAGLIGGIERYLEGGATALPCAISTIMAGAVAGLVHWRYKQFPKVHVAVITSFVLMVVHMVLVATISNPASVGLSIAEVIAFPMTLFAVAGMLLFSVLYFRTMRPS